MYGKLSNTGSLDTLYSHHLGSQTLNIQFLLLVQWGKLKVHTQRVCDYHDDSHQLNMPTVQHIICSVGSHWVKLGSD